MSELLNKWLRHYDPIHRGWTPAGIANGVCTTCGYSFPRIRGGYNLRRSPGPAALVVGSAGADAAEIRTFPWIGHDALTDYTYRLTAVNGGGVENSIEQSVAFASFDSQGAWCGAWPNPPGDLRVRALAGGRFEVCWTYTAKGQQAEPVEFRVYSDGGRGTVDYTLPAGVVAYRRGRLQFTYTSSGFADGVKVWWAVRACSDTGEERNDTRVSCRADAAGPAVAPTVLLSLV